MFHRPNTENRVENTTRMPQRSIFDEIHGVWIAEEALSLIWYISVETKTTWGVNGEVKSSKSMLIKTGCIQTSYAAVVIFFVLKLLNVRDFYKVLALVSWKPWKNFSWPNFRDLPFARLFKSLNRGYKTGIECVRCHAIKDKIKSHAVDKVKKLWL